MDAGPESYKRNIALPLPLAKYFLKKMFLLRLIFVDRFNSKSRSRPRPSLTENIILMGNENKNWEKSHNLHLHVVI